MHTHQKEKKNHIRYIPIPCLSKRVRKDSNFLVVSSAAIRDGDDEVEEDEEEELR